MTYCGYLIQHYPVVDMLMKPIEHRFESSPRYVILLVEYIIRYAVVFLTFGLAYAIPNFKEIIPFVGVTTGMMLALSALNAFNQTDATHPQRTWALISRYFTGLPYPHISDAVWLRAPRPPNGTVNKL
ncbi:hypothetical protein RB195_017151 [Necator americanus]|uniref:Amino acid transporter transmembrane domain-containing protein n=1 Tax=Necator americanus TaxID=51031 RepID=A0ABR1C3V5_NECAM